MEVLPPTCRDSRMLIHTNDVPVDYDWLAAGAILGDLLSPKVFFSSFLVPSAPTDKILHATRALFNLHHNCALVCNIWAKLETPGFAGQHIVKNI